MILDPVEMVAVALICWRYSCEWRAPPARAEKPRRKAKAKPRPRVDVPPRNPVRT